MTTDEIKSLSIQEKLQMMEALWQDLRERFDRLEIPEEQKKLLDQRRERVRTGDAQLHDWDSVKGSVGRA
ncbi:MAG: addiction module protein [Verrucomicrobiota bacterium]